MNTTIKQGSALVSPKAEPKETNMPERKFRAGTICATIWLNKGQKTNGEDSEYRTISIERNYIDKEGKWQSTNSMRVADLPKVMVVIQKAYESIILNENDSVKVN